MKKKEEIAAGRGRGTVQLTAADMDAAKLKPLNGKYSRHICESQRAAYDWANQLARATNWGYTTLVIKDGRKWAAIVPDRWINEAIKLNLDGYINELKADVAATPVVAADNKPKLLSAERIGFDAAPPSLADDVKAIRALLVDAPPETPDTTPEALRHGPDAGLTDELYVTDVESEAHQLVSQLAASLIRATVKAGNPTRTPFYAVYVSPDASDRARVVRARLFESWHVGHIQTFAALPSETTEDK